MNKERLAREIHKLLPAADVRTDQCDTVRIHGNEMVCAISKNIDGWLEIVFCLQDEPTDFLPESTLRIPALDEKEAAEKYARWLPIACDLIDRVGCR